MKVSVVLAAFVPFVIGQAVNPAAFNPQLTNSIPNVGGPVLYYNGSGPVPPYNSSTPSPPPLPALTYSPLLYRDVNFFVVRRNSKINSTQKSHPLTAEISSPTIAPHALRLSKSSTSQLWRYLLKTPLISLSASVISRSLQGQIVLANTREWATKAPIWCKCMPQ
jgi:hypothetical protein